MTQHTETQKLTLVLGGTGKTGRRVATRLRARGRPIRISSRSGEPPFDWADPATWAPALQDVGSVYLAYSPDIGDVAVAALTEDGHAGQIYELTSSRLLTFAEAVGEIAKATGREIRYVPVSAEQYASMLTQYGFPPEVGAFLTELFAELLDGRNSHLTDGVGRSLGREPRDFADYARDAAATSVWAT